MAEQYRNFMDYLWVQKEDNVYTIGLNEDALDDIESIKSVDLPPEGEAIESEVVLGQIETDQGQIDIFSPVSGSVTEVNTTVVEDPSLIQDDPYDAWLLKIESDEDFSDDDEDDEDDEDFDDEDEEDDEEDEDEEDSDDDDY